MNRSVRVHRQEYMNGAWIYVVTFYDNEISLGHWPTDEERLTAFIHDWIVDGKRPQ